MNNPKKGRTVKAWQQNDKHTGPQIKKSRFEPSVARDIVLCSWARHLTLRLPLSDQVNKWVPANLMLGVTLQSTSIPSRKE